MKRKSNQKNYLIYVFILLILSIGIGYALLQTNLNINGLADIGINEWDIHFDNVQVKSGSVTATTPATINPQDNTKVNYAIKLDKPGNYYEFTVDIVNAGTLPGEISLVTVSGIDSTYADIIKYSVYYINGFPVKVGDILNDGSTKTIKIRTYFNTDIDNDDLPSEDFSLNLVLDINYIQAEGRETTTSTLLQDLAANNSCITKYNGEVTEKVGQTVTANNIYFNNCSDKRNVIFGGFCWQVIRTTETGGIKMIYNGEPVSGKCESTRTDHKGIIGTDGEEEYLATSMLYGNSFTYDTNNNTFTLQDTFTSTWSDSTYENIIGTYTCFNNSSTCTTLHSINGYKSNTTGYGTELTVGNVNYYEIGTSPFNAQFSSPAKVGYMFNKTYHSLEKSLTTSPIKYGNSFTYDSNTNTYTLSGTTQTISNWSTGYNTINNTHYTCWNTSGSCNTISYIYYTTDEFATYFDMENGKGISDILTEMLHADNVNHYNSSIKGIIDTWYAKKLSLYTEILEDVVYCNDRTILDIGAMNPDGGNTYNYSWLNFKNFNQTTSLVCTNMTDQFSTSNNKAKLIYPVSLVTTEELANITNNSLRRVGTWYHNLTPNYYASAASFDYVVNIDGSISYVATSQSGGVRPVITIAPNNPIVSGTGSETDPWIASYTREQ